MLTNLFETNGHWAPLERCIFIVLCIISTICRTFCGVINSLLHACACTALWLWCLAPTLSFWRPKLMPFISIYTNSRYLPMRLFLFCVMRFGQGGWGGRWRGWKTTNHLTPRNALQLQGKAKKKQPPHPPPWLGGVRPPLISYIHKVLQFSRRTERKFRQTCMLLGELHA